MIIKHIITSCKANNNTGTLPNFSSDNLPTSGAKNGSSAIRNDCKTPEIVTAAMLNVSMDTCAV